MDNPRSRREEGAFIAEGPRLFSEIPGDLLLSVYLSESFREKNPEISGEVVSDKAFKRLSDTKTPQGILALVKIPEYSLSDLFRGEKGLYIICEGLQDPGNLGTILRTGEAAGLRCLIADRDTVDVYSPKVVRSTMGAVFRVPCIYTDDLPSLIGRMKEEGISVYAADLKGSEEYQKTDYKKRSAFLIGNEGRGLSQKISDMSDKKIKIPMKGRVESLNAAVSAALLMYGYCIKTGEF